MAESSDQCEVCKVFSNPNRLGILLALREGSRTVSEIVKETGASQSVISQHLSMMKARGIVTSQRKGAYIQYSIKYPEIMDAFDIMRAVTDKIQGK